MSTLPPFAATAFAADMAVFRRKGINAPTDTDLATALGTTPAALTAQYPDRAALLLHSLRTDLERQKQDHVRLYARFASAVERLYALINYTIEDLVATDASYLTDLAQFPVAWQLVQDHLATYSTPQLHQLLNEGILQGLFRSDINIRLVTIIIIQQVNIAITPGLFPAGSFQAAEIFRSIFLYYIRGLCTEQGAHLAAEHFARM